MKIIDVLCEPVRTGFYRDDQAAVRAGALHDGFLYTGDPVTPGFGAIRQPGTAISVMLVLSDGQVAFGDCAEVQYTGAGGRAPALAVAAAMTQIRDHVAPALRNRDLTGFRELAQEIDTQQTNNGPLSVAVRYGVTQALLHAISLSQSVTMAEVIQAEYSTGIQVRKVPLYAQSGDDRYSNVDKMILKEVEVLPHGLINEVNSKLGADGELLKKYVRWLRDRIISVRTRQDYVPCLHLDTYGTVGLAFDHDLDRIATYLGELADEAAPFTLRVEHPIDAGSREAQIRIYSELRRILGQRNIAVDLVVDEWCNTVEDIRAFVDAGAADVIHVKTPDLGGINNSIEALLYVRRHGFSAYCGGTCNETDISARVCTHIAMACGANQVLAKPGMGVDEGVMIVGNEMIRTAALAERRSAYLSASTGSAAL